MLVEIYLVTAKPIDLRTWGELRSLAGGAAWPIEARADWGTNVNVTSGHHCYRFAVSGEGKVTVAVRDVATQRTIDSPKEYDSTQVQAGLTYLFEVP
jgi:hypothetical protein